MTWPITWWTCKTQWWMEWKETLWWWLQPFQRWCGLTHSFLDSFLQKFHSPSPKNSDPWPNQESTWRISMSVTFLEHHFTFLLCSAWDKLTLYSWNNKQMKNNTKINLERNQELPKEPKEEWLLIQWWAVWWDQTWWIKAIKINLKKTFLNLKFKLSNS